jgi:hypothetical protein
MNHIWHQQWYQNLHNQQHKNLANRWQPQQEADKGQSAESENRQETLLLRGRATALVAFRAMFHGL